MPTQHSLVPLIKDIEDAGKFLLDRGFKIVFGSEYYIDIISDDYVLEIEVERHYGGMFFRVRPKSERLGISISTCARYDPDIEYGDYFTDDMSLKELIHNSFKLIDKHYEKILNKNYLLDMKKRFSPLVEGGYCDIANHKKNMT